MKKSLVVLATLLMAQTGAGAAAPPPEWGGPVKGAVVGRAVLTCAAGRWGFRAYAHPLGEDAVFRGVQFGGATRETFRWHGGHGGLWVCGDTRPIRTAGALDDDDALVYFDLPSLLKGKAVPAPGAPASAGGSIFAQNTPVYLGRTRAEAVQAEHPFEVYYDCLPVGRLPPKQFVLTDLPQTTVKQLTEQEGEAPRKPRHWPWSFTAYRYEGRWDARKEEWESRRWVKEADLAVAFKEPFHALGVGGDYYFVTRSGRLFHSPPAPKGKVRTAQAVWDFPARPITAFLTDADTGRAFLFVPPKGKGGKPAFFEAAARPKPVAYDPSSVPLPPYDEPHRGILHKARVLRALGKLAK